MSHTSEPNGPDAGGEGSRCGRSVQRLDLMKLFCIAALMSDRGATVWREQSDPFLMFEGPKAADVLDDILQAVIQAEARSWRCA